MLEYVEYFGHVAYTLIFFSFLVRKMYLLRILAIVAGVFSIAFNYYVPKEPLWTPIQWNCLFIATNLVQITLIILEKRKVTFTGHLKELHDSIFNTFMPMEFKKVIDSAHFRTSKAGTTLIDDDIEMSGLLLLVNGAASIEKNGKEIVTLNEGSFLGEMSFLTGDHTRAKVVAKSQVKYYVWDKEDLNNLLRKNPAINSKFIGALGRQIIDELIESHKKNAA